MVYIDTYIWLLIFIGNVGIYTSPMDGMGFVSGQPTSTSTQCPRLQSAARKVGPGWVRWVPLPTTVEAAREPRFLVPRI